MRVWSPSPVPAQQSAGVAALFASAAVLFVPQAFPAQLMGVAGTRSSAPPSQQQGFQAQLLPQVPNPIIPLRPDAQAMAIASMRSVPLPIQGRMEYAALFPAASSFAPPFEGPVSTQRAALATYRKTTIPIQPYPLMPDLLDWYEADGAVGQGDIQEAIHAGYRRPALPIQAQSFNAALFPTTASSPPDINTAIRMASLFRSPAMPRQQWPQYSSAFDGPYQAPPLTVPQPPAVRPLSIPAQAFGINPALLASLQVDPQPLAAILPSASLARISALPIQASALSAALIPAVPAPSLIPGLAYPYTAIWKASTLPQQAPVICPDLYVPNPPAPPLAILFPWASLFRSPAYQAQATPFSPAPFLGVQVNNPPFGLLQGFSPAVYRPPILPAQTPQGYPFSAAGPYQDPPFQIFGQSAWLARSAPIPSPVALGLTPALFSAATGTPPILTPYPYAALWRATGAIPSAGSQAYNPAFDGPYQAPPFILQAPVFFRIISIPQQAAFNIAPLTGVLSQPPPAMPFQVAAYLRAPGLPSQSNPIPPSLYASAPLIVPFAWPVFAGSRSIPDQAQRFHAALFLAPTAPPLVAIAGMPPAPFKPLILPAQGIPFNAAFLPPQVDEPPLGMPFSYVALARPMQGPRHAPMAYPLFESPPALPPQPSQLYASGDYFLIEIRAQDYFF